MKPEEEEDLAEALASAFPYWDTLERLTRFKLGTPLTSIAAESDTVPTITKNLVIWAVTHGRVRGLLRGAQEANSGNPKLLEFVRTHRKLGVLTPGDLNEISELLEKIWTNEIADRCVAQLGEKARIANVGPDELGALSKKSSDEEEDLVIQLARRAHKAQPNDAALATWTGRFPTPEHFESVPPPPGPPLPPPPPPPPPSVPPWMVPSAFVVGIIAVAGVVILAVAVPKPSQFQWDVFKTVLALGGSAFAMGITGLVTINLRLGAGVAISAAGALAVFIVLYFFAPAIGSGIGVVPPPPVPDPPDAGTDAAGDAGPQDAKSCIAARLVPEYGEIRARQLATWSLDPLGEESNHYAPELRQFLDIPANQSHVLECTKKFGGKPVTLLTVVVAGSSRLHCETRAIVRVRGGATSEACTPDNGQCKLLAQTTDGEGKYVVDIVCPGARPATLALSAEHRSDSVHLVPSCEATCNSVQKAQVLQAMGENLQRNVRYRITRGSAGYAVTKNLSEDAGTIPSASITGCFDDCNVP